MNKTRKNADKFFIFPVGFFRQTGCFAVENGIHKSFGKNIEGELFRKCFGDGKKDNGLIERFCIDLLLNCGEIVGELWKNKSGFDQFFKNVNG